MNGTPKIDELTIRTITDGSTLANALQLGRNTGSLRYGLRKLSVVLKNDAYTFSQISTSPLFLWKDEF